MDKYDISVITPIYNMEKFAAAGVRSLKEQTGINAEFIFVNDGSKDKSAEIIEAEIAGLPNFRLISTENRGAGPARNTGIEAASGKYLYFFDIDDRLVSGALKKMFELAESAGCDLLVFAYIARLSDTDEPKLIKRIQKSVSGDEARKNYDKYMVGETAIQGAPWNKLFRRDITTENGIEYPPLRRNQDEVFIMRYMAHAEKIRIESDALYDHLLNTQERMWLKYRLDYDENTEKLFGFYNDIILKWNPDSSGVKRLLSRAYYKNMLDAMKVLFNPKWKLGTKEKYEMLKKRLLKYRENAVKYDTGTTDELVRKSRLYPFMRKGPAIILYTLLSLNAKKKSALKI
ncbi:MAG: glycosyltransferase [Eubacteriales bacterium]|nr:glycosyltransferase [Eubacteriales bacterium]MDD3880731.1 glycosyltransferase [Eubacteriales bacterium]MDD4511635.1 glycosyltransferase [Eubacteriales bacterium]